MANVIAYAQLFQTMLDDQMISEMTSGWMEANASMIRYNGGDTVRIPKMGTTGLGDYSRATGFPAGSVTLEWETHTFEKDRGTTFSLDSQDVDESNFVATATTVMTQFQRTEVAPEVDAYRYAKVFELANAAEKTSGYTADASTIFAALKADIAAVQDVVGEREPIVIAMSIPVASILDQADKIEKTIRYDEFVMGEDSTGKKLATKVGFLDNVPIIRVPSARMKSEYTFSATDGFTPAAGALSINWQIVARRSVFGIVKQDKMRMFDPDTNQTADAWKMDYRKYHTLIIPDNKLEGILVNYEVDTAPTLSVTIAGGTASGTTSATAAGTLVYTLTSSEQDKTLGVKPVGGISYTSGDDIAATVGQWLNVYAVDADGNTVTAASDQLEAGDIT